jgi:putative ABC transport system permease protein
VVGVALGVGLFASIAFFIDGSAASMTQRAVATLPLDMEVTLSSPLASSLTLKETLATTNQSLANGDTVTANLVVTNESSTPATAVVIKDEPAVPLSYLPNSTKLNGVLVPDDEEGKALLLSGGVTIASLAPKASATITYQARATSPVPTIRALAYRGTVSSAQDPQPTNANGPSPLTLDDLMAPITKLRDVSSADPLMFVDLPPGLVRSGSSVIQNQVRIYGLNLLYQVRYPTFSLTSGTFSPDGAVLSVEASKVLSAQVGKPVDLYLPGRPQPMRLNTSGVADLSNSPQLFNSRLSDSLGDFTYLPYVVIVSPETFQSSVIPALRLDAGAARPILKNPPVMELDVRVDRTALNSDPATALRRTQGLRRSIERIAPGQLFVIDTISSTLTVAKTDALVGKILFLFLGLPGVLLAAYLAGYAGSLLAQAQRREQATLRARGAQPGHLNWLLAYSTLWVAGLGSAIGLTLGVGAMIQIFGMQSLTTIDRRELELSAAAAAAAGLLSTTLALYLPGWRALSREVTEERRELEADRPAAWLRLRLDLVLIAVALIVEAVTYVSGGFRPVTAEASQGETLSLSFYMLLAPLAAWFGAVLLGVRIFLALTSRIPNPRRASFGSLAGGTLRRSLKRRPRGLAAGIIAIGLAQAFGGAVAIFVATYHAEKVADARYVVGADVSLTPSPINPQPPQFVTQLTTLPEVASASPVMFHQHNATVGNDTKDLVAVDVASLTRTADLPDSFFPNGSASATMDALKADPGAVLVDTELAKDAGITVGDRFKLLVKDAGGNEVPTHVRAVGLFTRFPGFPQHVDVVANQAFYQSATGLHNADYFLVRASDRSPAGVARAANAIRDGPGQTVPIRIITTETAFNVDQSSLAALNLNGLARLDLFYVTLMTTAGIGIFIFGLLLQRRKEYMTLRALGIRMRQLQTLLLGEAAVVSILGVVVALGVSTAMAFMFVQILRPVFTLPPDRITFPVEQLASLAGLAVGSMLVCSLAAGVLLSRINPVELVREE